METFSDEHQWISLEIATAFRNYLNGSRYTVRQNMDVWTGESSGKDEDSVTPDILIYCAKDQRQGGIIQSPRLVVEIWSPTNMPRERTRKLAEYYRIGVKEFWEIDYAKQEFSILSFADGALRFLSGGTFHEPLESQYFPDLKVDLSEYYSEFG